MTALSRIVRLLGLSHRVPEGSSGLATRLRARARAMHVLGAFVLIATVTVPTLGLFFFMTQSSSIALDDFEAHSAATAVSDQQITELTAGYGAIAELESQLATLTSELASVSDRAARSFGSAAYEFTTEDLRITLLTLEDPVKGIQEATKGIKFRLDKRTQDATRLNGDLLAAQNALAVISGLKGADDTLQQHRIELARGEVTRIEQALASASVDVAALKELLLDPNAVENERSTRLKQAKERLQVETSRHSNSKVYFDQEKERNERRKLELQVVLPKKTEELNTAKSRLAVLEAHVSAQGDPSADDSKTLFVITSNVIRIGSVIVLLFFAQILLSVYKYSARLAGHYSARADAIDLQSGYKVEGLEQFGGSLARLVSILDPSDVTFERMPKSLVNEVAAVLAKTGTARPKD